MTLLNLETLSRSKKRMILIAVDVILIPISLYLAFALRYGTFLPFSFLAQSWILFPTMMVIGLLVIWQFKLHKVKLMAFETTAMTNVALASICLGIAASGMSYLYGLSGPRTVPIIFGAYFFLLSVSARLVAVKLLNWLLYGKSARASVAIYGAGSAGIQLAAALRQSKEYKTVFFVDDNSALHGLQVAGLPVHATENLGKLVDKHQIKQILLAAPTMPENRQAEVIKDLEPLGVELKVLPSYVELISGDSIVDSLRPVSPDALLGRGKVELDVPEIAKSYFGRVVMVTGAGGSIGSELARQILACNPAKIVLFEQSEFQLYSIDQELIPLAKDVDVPVVARLGSVTDKARVGQVIADQGVDIILHAAAYKHVPLVEDNPLQGAQNNVIGTKVVAEAAAEADIERFILVSTDKAVRPTNVMGATKRMAELVIQDIQTRHPTTKYSMVRFGNVLGSSGSVLPLFQKQIAMGGPVTVTHDKVTRFFMTIPEAARLVLLAGAYAKNGDVFVLDMGEPQRIVDIAKRMIALTGRTVRDPKTGVGDIEIKITGLRPGEKLYEELLIDDDSLVATPHPKILRAQEAMLSQLEVAGMVRGITNAVTADDADMLINVIKERVDGYHTQHVDTA